MSPTIAGRTAASETAHAPGSAEAVLTVINQLTEAIRAETEDLVNRRSGANHHDYNLKKSQALLVMNRFAPLLTQVKANSDLQTSLLSLCSELETNRRLLGLQLRAAQAVSELITRAIREGQSDGTYSPLPWRNDAA
jgi:hypothetical protein